jgi:hypothetical protein
MFVEQRYGLRPNRRSTNIEWRYLTYILLDFDHTAVPQISNGGI